MDLNSIASTILATAACAFVGLFSAEVDGVAPHPPPAQQAASTVVPRTEPARPQKRKPTREENGQLEAVANRLRPGVVLLGTLDRDDDTRKLVNERGTGFVVSRKQRLVVTAAHVADVGEDSGPMLAVVAGTKQSYRVVQTWYHPRTMRRLDGGLYAALDGPARWPGGDGRRGHRVATA